MNKLKERASVIAGGVMTRSKAIFGEWASDAYGAEVFASSGRYLDMLCALGAVTLGHRQTEEERSGMLSLPYDGEIRAAEAVLKRVAPWASHVRFTCTGSEATHAAYRIAKKATGRSIVLKGDWAYHGWHEWTEQCQEFALGENLERSYGFWFADGGEGVAAVFIEPHRFKELKNHKEWLLSIRAFCDKYGALLVYDSMIWGGRHALGGLSEWSGVIPDLECFGKFLGNGLPVACVVGRDALRDHGSIVSGTYSGFPYAMDRVCEVLSTYATEPVIETLWARGRQLQNGLKAIVPADVGVCEGYPVHQRVRFFDESLGPKMTQAMLKRGVIWHHACANVMLAHTEQHIDQVLEAFADSLKEIL